MRCLSARTSPADGCACRKPGLQLAQEYLRERDVDLAASAMVGDRDTDLEFAANLGVRGFAISLDGDDGRRPGLRIVQA